MITIVDSLPEIKNKKGQKRYEYVAEDLRAFIDSGAEVALVTNEGFTCERLYQAFYLHLYYNPNLGRKVEIKRRQNNIYLVRKDMQ